MHGVLAWAGGVSILHDLRAVGVVKWYTNWLLILGAI